MKGIGVILRYVSSVFMKFFVFLRLILPESAMGSIKSDVSSSAFIAKAAIGPINT